MRILNNLIKVAAVAGYSEATAECVFSARNRLDTPCRRRLPPYKQGNLTLLHFEKKIVRNVRFPEFATHCLPFCAREACAPAYRGRLVAYRGQLVAGRACLRAIRRWNVSQGHASRYS